MVLTKADVGTPATIVHRHYSRPKDAGDQNALSAFDLEMSPAGSFDYLEHEVLVANSKREAAYFGAIAVGQTVAAAGSRTRAAPVDLGGLGDHARAALLHLTFGGSSAYGTVIVFYRGSYLGFVVAQSLSKLSEADVRKLAQVAAKRFDAGFSR